MSDLIVDFPQHRISRSNGGRAIRFSPRSIAYSFERVQEKEEVWYSDVERETIRQRNMQDVLDLHRTLPSLISSSNTEALIEKTGLENTLSPKIRHKIKVARRRHLEAVLVEQRRQAEAGEYDTSKIADVSRRFSDWSRRRASIIGQLQSKKE